MSMVQEAKDLAKGEVKYVGQGVAMHSCQGLERFDLQGSPPTAPLGLPCPADESTCEEGSRDHAVLRGECPTVLLGDEAGAICVGEDQVVELGQESWRSQGIGVGHRGVGHIEEFFSALVAEDAEALDPDGRKPVERMAHYLVSEVEAH